MTPANTVELLHRAPNLIIYSEIFGAGFLVSNSSLFTTNRCEPCSYSSTNTIPSTLTQKWGAAGFFNAQKGTMKKVRHGPAQKKSKGVLTQSQPLPSVFPFVNHFFSLFCQLQELFLDLDGEQRAGLLHKHQAAAPPNPTLADTAWVPQEVTSPSKQQLVFSSKYK